MHWKLQLNLEVRATKSRRCAPQIILPSHCQLLSLGQNLANPFFIDVICQSFGNDQVQSFEILCLTQLCKAGTIHFLSQHAGGTQASQLLAALLHILGILHFLHVQRVAHQSRAITMVVHPHVVLQSRPTGLRQPLRKRAIPMTHHGCTLSGIHCHQLQLCNKFHDANDSLEVACGGVHAQAVPENSNQSLLAWRGHLSLQPPNQWHAGSNTCVGAASCRQSAHQGLRN